jgi:hypothetical protein
MSLFVSILRCKKEWLHAIYIFFRAADATICNEEFRKHFERFITFGYPVVRALTDDFRFQLKHKFASLRGIHGFAKRRSKLTWSRNLPSSVASTVHRRRENRKGTNRSKTMRTERGCVGRESVEKKERRSEREEDVKRRREDQPAPLLTGQRVIQQLGGPLIVLFFNGYTLFYTLFRLPSPGHTARRAFHSHFLPPHKCVFRANTFCVASENARRAMALKAGDSVWNKIGSMGGQAKDKTRWFTLHSFSSRRSLELILQVTCAYMIKDGTVL